jgi:hypothetical protein
MNCDGREEEVQERRREPKDSVQAVHEPVARPVIRAYGHPAVRGSREPPSRKCKERRARRPRDSAGSICARIFLVEPFVLRDYVDASGVRPIPNLRIEIGKGESGRMTRPPGLYRFCPPP